MRAPALINSARLRLRSRGITCGLPCDGLYFLDCYLRRCHRCHFNVRRIARPLRYISATDVYCFTVKNVNVPRGVVNLDDISKRRNYISVSSKEIALKAATNKDSSRNIRKS